MIYTTECAAINKNVTNRNSIVEGVHIEETILLFRNKNNQLNNKIPAAVFRRVINP